MKVAVPNKGMLSQPAWRLLSESGYRLRSNDRQLVVDDVDNDIQLFYLRPNDIAVYVGLGTMALTAAHCLSCREETVGDSYPGVMPTAMATRSTGMS